MILSELSLRWIERVVFAFALLAPLNAFSASDEMRPALVGSGPKSLVNLIDAETLMRKGQRDAWVMFEGLILDDGIMSASDFATFSPNSELLRGELHRRLPLAKFVPAIYHRRGAYAYFSGTVIFVVKDGKPHVRVFANQDLDEIKRGADFIAPQPVAVSGQAGITNWPNSPSGTYSTGGVVKLRHNVSAEGKTLDVRVLSVRPNDRAMADAAVKMVGLLDYLPPYRNGHPVTASFTETWWFGETHRW